MQLTNQGNMPRRTLFYLSKMYIESIKSGGKYEDLKKTITINIVDFNLFNISRFHSTFHFYEDHEESFMLTDAMKIHFIEYKELMQMDPIIKKAEERLEWLSSDEETRRLYEFREHSQIERNSNISEGEARGEARGIAGVALSMLHKGMDTSLIAEFTGMSIEEINRLWKTSRN